MRLDLGRKKTHEEFVSEMHEKYGNEYETVDFYRLSNKSLLMKHNLKDGTSHSFTTTPNRILRYGGCGVCHNLQIHVGFNDMHTTNKPLSMLLNNFNDGYKYTEWSSSKLDFKCPDCGHIVNKTISQANRDGVCCPKCNDGYSYPNKFIFNIMSQVAHELDFLRREYSPNWCEFTIDNNIKRGRYDIYFGISGKEYFVEADGGLGHGNRTIDKDETKEYAIDIDNFKDSLALHHGITPIRINCDYGRDDRFEYIMNNVKESKLKELIDFKNIDFNKANIDSQNSLFVKCCKIWNDNHSVKEISSKLNIVKSTVTLYLKRGAELGLCKEYSTEESVYRSHSNSVICLTTNMVFKSITDGANYYGLSTSVISKCCRKLVSFGGRCNGENLIWMYHSEYIKLSQEEIINYTPKLDSRSSKVVCVNNNTIFERIKTASYWCNAKSHTGIINCCKGKSKTSGVHPETGEKLKWMYYDDYIKINEGNSSDLENLVAFSR